MVVRKETMQGVCEMIYESVFANHLRKFDTFSYGAIRLKYLEKCILIRHKYGGATGLQMLCIVSDKNLVWQYQKKSVSLQKYSKEEYCTFPIVKHIYSK